MSIDPFQLSAFQLMNSPTLTEYASGLIRHEHSLSGMFSPLSFHHSFDTHMKYACDSRRQIHHATKLGWTLPEAPGGLWLPSQQQQQNMCTFDILQENISKHNFTC